jgi:phage FluMu gp28-like protein
MTRFETEVRDVSALDDAVGLVRAALIGGPRPATEVAALAATHRISSATLRRATEQIPVVKRKEGQPGQPGRWVWSLPEDASANASVFDAGAAHLRAGEIMAGLVLENGKTWGECAAPVQVADAEAVLSSGPHARRHWIGRGRGFSKTSDAGAMTIAAVLGGVIEPGERGFFCAADKDQARLAADAIAGWARRSELGALVVVEQSRVKFPRHDVEVEIMSSDAPSAWGRRGAWWVVDELAAWSDSPNPRAFYEAVSTSWPKVPTARIIIITTAGSPSHFSHAIYEAARTDPAWRVSDCHEIAPWLEQDAIEGERRRLSAASFSRLWRNEWVEAEDHLVTSENLARCVTLDPWPLKPQRGTRYVIGVDLATKFDSTAVCVAHSEHRDGERRIVVDNMEVFEPRRGREVSLGDVERRIEQLASRYRPAEVFFDPQNASLMLENLRGRHVRVEEFKFTAPANDKMTNTLHVMLRDGLIDLPDDERLLDELLSVRVVETRLGGVKIDTMPGKHDDQVDALGIAVEVLMSRRASTGRVGGGVASAPYTPIGRLPDHVVTTYNPLVDDPFAHAERLLEQERRGW